MRKTYFVYIMTNKTKTVLYTGVTNDLDRRLMEHRSGKIKGFTSKYKVTDLVYFETTDDINSAIDREKQIKAGSREDKVNLINQIKMRMEGLVAGIVEKVRDRHASLAMTNWLCFTLLIGCWTKMR